MNKIAKIITDTNEVLKSLLCLSKTLIFICVIVYCLDKITFFERLKTLSFFNSFKSSYNEKDIESIRKTFKNNIRVRSCKDMDCKTF